MRFFAAVVIPLSSCLFAEAAVVERLLDVQVANLKRSDCGTPATVTVTQTVLASTALVAIENSSQISADIASAASIETAVESVSAELTPINPTATTTTSLTSTNYANLTVTEYVPAVKVTISSSVSELSFIVTNGTTSWLDGISPTATTSMAILTTTVQISPTPATPFATSNTTTTIIQSTTQTLLTSPRPKWSSTFGWSNTSTLAAPTGFPALTGSGYSQPSAVMSTAVLTSVASMYSAGWSSSSTLYGGYEHPRVGPVSNLTAAGDIKRQVGATVTVTTDGTTWTWTNAWDGSTSVDLSTYSPSPSGSTSFSSLEPTTTASTLPGSTVTSTESLISVSSTSSATAATSSCGVSGAWVLGFDDLPKYSPPNNDTQDFPPIFNPHDLLFFSDGWSYVPPPNEPFPPQMGSQLAEFIPTDSTDGSSTSSPDSGLVPPGGFGAGPRAASDMFWFNVDSAYVGCNNSQASVDCDFAVYGYRYDNVTQDSREFVTIHFPVPGCQNFEGCSLARIDFGDWFEGISAIAFTASVNGTGVNWFMDSVAMSWWNNTCAAGLYRIQHEH